MYGFLKKYLQYTFWITISILTGILLMSLSIKTTRYAHGLLKNRQSIVQKIKNVPANYATANALSVWEIKEINPQTQKNTSLLFVGDIMLSRGVQKSVMKNFGGDFSLLFKKIKPFIQKRDIIFGNLEGPVSLLGKEIGNLYSFRMTPKALKAIRGAGFSALSIANNHIGDWGVRAFEDTIFRLKNSDIIPVGGGYDLNDAVNPKIIFKNGLKFGFLGFSDVGPDWLEASSDKAGILIANKSFTDIIKKASQKTDVLIVSMHFGEEYHKHPSKRQKMLAKEAIDSGAKIVIGHHPHTQQKIEIYKKGIIAYSLGNFIF
ncbi:MAG TPA: CapA family protein, partial [bacterium]|nr:CapA family protein [bacterium]